MRNRDTDGGGVFVVGRISKGEQRLVFVRSVPRPPFPGPWELRAVLAR